jgi:hypothetical protein
MATKVVKDWITSAGLRAVIVLSHDGSHHCGYVAVPAGHPDFGKDYDEVDAIVHGGLTYGAFASKYPVDTTPESIYWLGYDCAHSGDELRGRMGELLSSIGEFPLSKGVWRDEAFCTAECESLAEQLQAHAMA